MLSLLADLDAPAVAAFLTAVDEVMNSNTFLLKARVRAPITPENREEALSEFLRSRSFHEMILQADQERDWWMFHESPWRTPDPSLSRPADAGPWLFPADLRLTLRPMDEAAFHARLRWMLCEAFSPYHRHFDRERAEETVGAFLREVFGTDGWSFADVEPDFLPSTEYYTGEPCPDLAYFDGGESDTATLAHRGDVLILLLTNGSP